MGGLGIPTIFSELCDREFRNSVRATEQLSEIIRDQISDYTTINTQQQKEVEAIIQRERNEHEKQTLKDLRRRMTKEEIRANDITQMKGASSWLNSLPLKEEGYSLNKREFYDAVALRCGSCHDL